MIEALLWLRRRGDAAAPSGVSIYAISMRRYPLGLGNDCHRDAWVPLPRWGWGTKPTVTTCVASPIIRMKRSNPFD